MCLSYYATEIFATGGGIHRNFLKAGVLVDKLPNVQCKVLTQEMYCREYIIDKESLAMVPVKLANGNSTEDDHRYLASSQCLVD